MELSCERMTPGHFDPLIEKEHWERYTFAASRIKNHTVCDVACGTGYGSKLLADAGAASVEGFDISPDAIAYAKKNFSTPNVSFNILSAENLLGVPDGHFSIVTSFETIEHLSNVEVYVQEMHRILKPGGSFFVSTPDRRLASVFYSFQGHPANSYHVREFTHKELVTTLTSVRLRG